MPIMSRHKLFRKDSDARKKIKIAEALLRVCMLGCVGKVLLVIPHTNEQHWILHTLQCLEKVKAVQEEEVTESELSAFLGRVWWK